MVSKQVPWMYAEAFCSLSFGPPSPLPRGDAGSTHAAFPGTTPEQSTSGDNLPLDLLMSPATGRRVLSHEGDGRRIGEWGDEG